MKFIWIVAFELIPLAKFEGETYSALILNDGILIQILLDIEF